MVLQDSLAQEELVVAKIRKGPAASGVARIIIRIFVLATLPP